LMDAPSDALAAGYFSEVTETAPDEGLADLLGQGAVNFLESFFRPTDKAPREKQRRVVVVTPSPTLQPAPRLRGHEGKQKPAQHASSPGQHRSSGQKSSAAGSSRAVKKKK